MEGEEEEGKKDGERRGEREGRGRNEPGEGTC